MQAQGWMSLHDSPCPALRSCGRIDEHWCRARNDTCDYPQVVRFFVVSRVVLWMTAYMSTGGAACMAALDAALHLACYRLLRDQFDADKVRALAHRWRV